MHRPASAQEEMSGIGAGIAAMDNERTAVLGEARKRHQGHEDPGLNATLDGFLLGDPADLSQRG
jgi:hypothetical protein